MPDFSYTARDNNGKKVNGTLSAATRRDALTQLEKRSLFPIKVDQTQGARKGGLFSFGRTAAPKKTVRALGEAGTNGAAKGLTVGKNGDGKPAIPKATSVKPPAFNPKDRLAHKPKEKASAPAPIRRRGRRINAQLLANTYAQLAALLKSGVPLLRSLRVIKDQTSNLALADVLDQIYAQVEDGTTLAEAMGRHPKIFSEMAISMVRAGGEGGFLEDALTRVADFTEKQEDMKGRTAGALAYPMFLAVVGTAVVTILVVFFVPKFEEMFARLREKGELPMITEILLGLSHFMGSWGWLVLVGMAVAGYLIYQKLQTEEGKYLRDKIQIKLPGVGSIFKSLAVSRFCRVLGTLLHNGVPILRSLEISSFSAGNRVLAGAINQASENISAGESLAAPLAASGHFPRTVVEMIAVAEESNSLETVLTDIADNLDKRTWRQLDLFVRLLEPAMLLVMAVVVLFVVIALLLPVLKMSMTI